MKTDSGMTQERPNELPLLLDQLWQQSLSQEIVEPVKHFAQLVAEECAKEYDEILKALIEATDVLEVLRRGHGVDVSSACYPALNHCRDAIQKAGAIREKFEVKS